MTDEEIRIQSLKLAIDSMYWVQLSGGEKYSATYQDKPMREIYNRADSIFAYIKDPNATTPTGIIAKLRDVLCVEQPR